MKRKKICDIVTIPMTIRAFFIAQLEYLCKSGFDVTVICQGDPTIKEDLGSKNINFIPLNIPRGISPIRMLTSVFNLIRIFKRNQYDMIQYSTPNAALVASLAGTLARIRIRNYHMMGIRYLGFQGVARNIFKIFEKITCKLSTSVECVSRSNLQLCIHEKLFPENKGIVVWNGSTGGIDTSRFDISKRNDYRRIIRKKLHISQDELIFGFVGRITKDKGIEELVNAFLKLSRKAKLLFVGDIENRNGLTPETLAALQYNPNIILHSFVTDIEKYFAALDCLVLPSYREGFGNVIIEAGAMGTGAIVSDIPGPKEIVEKIGGKVFKVKDTESLAKCMEEFHVADSQTISNNVKKNYDQKELNKQILLRKQQLLKENMGSRK